MWNSLQQHGIALNSEEQHGTMWTSMEQCRRAWNSMEQHGWTLQACGLGKKSDTKENILKDSIYIKDQHRQN